MCTFRQEAPLGVIRFTLVGFGARYSRLWPLVAMPSGRPSEIAGGAAVNEARRSEGSNGWLTIGALVALALLLAAGGVLASFVEIDSRLSLPPVVAV